MDRDRLIKQLTFDEGKKNFPYRDTVGKLTIGIGRNLDDKGLSNDEIEYLLQNDVTECFSRLHTTYPWFQNLNDIRQEVLVNMCFNLGFYGLSKFKNTLAFIEAGDYEQASINMLKSLWARQVGNRAVRLATMMKTGSPLTHNN